MYGRGCCGGPVVYPVYAGRNNTGTEIIAIAILILVALGIIF